MNQQQTRMGSTEIAGLLRREIQAGRLAAPERLQPERKLAEDYNVARGTIREALNKLEKEGLVDVRPGSGTYVTYEPIEETNTVVGNARPLELIDARFALEPHICRLAVLHARRQDFIHAEELLAEMEASVSDPYAFSTADTAFHNLLAETTGNSLLIWMVGQINSVRSQEQWSRMLHLTLNETTISHYNMQHRQILNAIRTREPERAAGLMKEHLETARLSLTRAAAT
ncbi:MAG: FadR family transcriptional regulator [Hyphomicrobiales bacterium]|nr:FadR family transcriptional regulator [Hyphomicrobiales bacterium]MCP4997599.1 FadR family transcriptional regulator [Hyphomicrobiales bacterium]